MSKRSESVPSCRSRSSDFLLGVAGAGQVDQRAGIGGDDHADAARQAQAQRQVILGGGVLDLADAGRHAVEPADDALLHGRRQAGDGAAGDAGLGAELVPVAGQLHDRPQLHVGMVAERLQAPDVPAAAVVGQILVGHRDVLACRRGAAGQGEHVDARIGQQRVEVAAANAVDVRLEVLVAGDGELAAEVGDGADRLRSGGRGRNRWRPGEPGCCGAGPPGLPRVVGGGLEGGQVAADGPRHDLAQADQQQPEEAHAEHLMGSGGSTVGVLPGKPGSASLPGSEGSHCFLPRPVLRERGSDAGPCRSPRPLSRSTGARETDS